MSEIRVLHVFKTYFPETVGGIEQVIRQLASVGKKKGVRSDVLTLTKGPSRVFRFEGQLVYAVRRDLDVASTGFSYQAFGALKRIIDRYDVVHYHYPWPFGDLLKLLIDANKPSLVTYHSDIVRQKFLGKLYAPLQRRFLNSVDCIVATSPSYLESSQTLKHYREKSTVVPIGLSKATYPVVSGNKIQCWKDEIDRDFFLFVGVLRYYKGLHILLEALKGTDLKVVIAGTGPVEGELKRLAQELGVSENVRFLGRVSEEDKVALLEACLGVVFPSHLRSEAFGITLLEGAMYGKPLISCEIKTGTSYINASGETGIVIPPSDSGALKEAMQTLAGDQLLVDRMGANAFRRYQTMFSDDVMFDGYYKAYKALLSKAQS